jgi:hypothetical protein
MRWRAFADLVAAALGLNLWVTVVLLPGFCVGAWGNPLAIAAAIAPLGILLIGLQRRSDRLLLLGFPLALLFPGSIYPELIAPHVYGAFRFLLVAASFVGYLLGAAFLGSFHEPPEPARNRALASSGQPVAPRWRRRFRVYSGATILSTVFPAALFYAVNYDTGNTAFLRELYPGKLQAFQTLLSLAALALWLVLYLWVFLGMLRPHRTGDRDLVVKLAMLRSETRRGRPRPAFYAGVALSLGFMLLLLALRYG